VRRNQKWHGRLANGSGRAARHAVRTESHSGVWP